MALCTQVWHLKACLNNNQQLPKVLVFLSNLEGKCVKAEKVTCIQTLHLHWKWRGQGTWSTWTGMQGWNPAGWTQIPISSLAAEKGDPSLAGSHSPDPSTSTNALLHQAHTCPGPAMRLSWEAALALEHLRPSSWVFFHPISKLSWPAAQLLTSPSGFMHQQSVAPDHKPAQPSQPFSSHLPVPEHQAPCQPRGVTSRNKSVRLSLNLCSQTDD